MWNFSGFDSVPLFFVGRVSQQDEPSVPITLAEPTTFSNVAEQKLFSFTQKHMASPEGGIYTNYLVSSDETKGHI
ncbi:hypothetical protein [Brevibacillus laterosporus]|uniref:hypothetical protein n=1 Tax=Brevibacillus laterosporus TaxID=1465 RepID=UPI000839CB5E|nr:hypothetical protein [Brevibacillus laterosporus]